MTPEEARSKLHEAMRLLTEVQNWAGDRFTSARGEEKTDHTFGWGLGIVVGCMISARESALTALGQTFHIKNKVD